MIIACVAFLILGGVLIGQSIAWSGRTQIAAHHTVSFMFGFSGALAVLTAALWLLAGVNAP